MPKPNRQSLAGTVAVSLLKALRSVKLAVVVLFLVAATSVAGSLIVQQADPEVYITLYGAAGWKIVSAIGLDNVFASWWFLAMIGWLAVSMFMCSLVRLPKIIKSVRGHGIVREESHYRRAQYSRSSSCPAGPEETAERLADSAAKLLSGNRYRITARSVDREGAYISAGKGLIGELGPVLVHMSIIVIIAGATWTALGKYSRELQVAVGQTERLEGTDYSVRLDDFLIEHYEGTDQPKEYVSRLSLVENDRPVGHGEVKVNKPLTLGGLSFYQWKYFPTASDVTIAVTGSADGLPAGKFKLPLGRAVHIEKLGLTLEADNFLPDFALTTDKVAVSRTPRFVNPAVQLKVYSGEKLLHSCWVFPEMGGFHGSKQADYTYTLADYTPTASSGLKVVRDRAVPLVYTGFVMLLAGTFLSCYVFHRRVWLMVRRDGDRLRLHLAGQCNRNLLDLRGELDRCFDKILPPPTDRKALDDRAQKAHDCAHYENEKERGD